VRGRALCADEDEAKECAVRLVDGQNLELWQATEGSQNLRGGTTPLRLAR
jgi:hypothetical protein